MRDRGEVQIAVQAVDDRPRGMDTDGVVITQRYLHAVGQKRRTHELMALMEGRGGARWGSPKLCGQGHRQIAGERADDWLDWAGDPLHPALDPDRPWSDPDTLTVRP